MIALHLHLHRSAARALGSSFAFAAVRPISGGAPRPAMKTPTTAKTGQTRVLWGCNPKRAESLAPRGDIKWEGDSEVEGNGRN